jgi:cell volume regulation protein A
VPFRTSARDVGLVSWVGLRGATPIILATFPVVAGVHNADTIFHVVFFVVLLSVIVQGTTIPIVATRLGLTTTPSPTASYTFDAVIEGDAEHGLREIVVREGAPAVGRTLVSLQLPTGVLVALIYRAGHILVPQGGSVLEAGDRLLLVAEDAQLAAARRVLTGSHHEQGD